jgi:pyruvate dehydrogenase E2 component (dihydrolipoamide acetyltransferase)
MVTRVVMPPLGDATTLFVLTRWLKHEGDPVVKGEPLFEVDTGKASIDIEALASGVLRRIVVPDGDEAEIGDVLALIGELDDVLPGV